MVYIMKIRMETKIIFSYLLLRLKHMVKEKDGLLNINMKLFLLLPLLAALKNRSSTLFKDLQKDLSAPPGTPYPNRRHQDDKKARREELVLPPRRHLQYDEEDEENKENLPPPDPKDEERRKAILSYLLEKWAEDIIWYQDQVLRDLSALKLKLGIPQL
uniref:E4 protein n=1 Tax=Human papillomavirus TaxID=10566 RepID=A0A385PM34_9PAPI|nr:MAG: E4 protein [Human papillomavirus]